MSQLQTFISKNESELSQCQSLLREYIALSGGIASKEQISKEQIKSLKRLRHLLINKLNNHIESFSIAEFLVQNKIKRNAKKQLYRKILHLHGNGKTYRQIGDELGIVGNVGQKLRTAYLWRGRGWLNQDPEEEMLL